MPLSCTHCGAALPDGAKFCVSCGTPVAGATPAAGTTPVADTTSMATPQPQTTPVQPVQPAQPAAATQPVQPGQPVYPAQSMYPGQPAYPNQPAYQAQPGQPVYVTQPVQSTQPMYPVQPGQVPPQAYPQAAAMPAAAVAKTPMSPKKRTTIIVVAVIAAIAIIAAVVFGVKASADARARNIDGTYSFISPDYSSFNLTVSNGHFSLTNFTDTGESLSGSIDRGTISGSSVVYQLTDLTATYSGRSGAESLAEILTYDFGIPLDYFDGSDIDSKLVNAITLQLTTPKAAVQGNVVGTWELSASLMNMKAVSSVLTLNQDNTFTYSSQIAGKSIYDEHGRWNDRGNGRYSLYDSYDSLITNVTMQH